MNLSKLYFPLIVLAFTILSCSCNQPVPRRPVTVRTGTFMKESAQRSKEILTYEEGQIKKIIANDSIHEYLMSSNGYWYYYNTKDTTQNYAPKEDDLVLMTYNLRTLENDTIYSFDEIGQREFIIDKEDYFPGLRTGIKLLHKGESATFFFPSPLAYGFYGDKDKIIANQPLISTIKLIDILKISKDSLLNE
ncbi:gliding motility-associated peptidyl-prolyl isomerase GldI [Abyssalbus ytuae]|uniref:Peptidyl-prolyl cis-trans isomerase n=1 Tax=Abyssalbus ytuae TaxID=2926907 RepID=A0A9E7CTJ1_9FLAO|nr:gliding motility-associated peptidyl-prolyl isomerase GldI [Abyssalbus ytuae]UOB18161.1 gliding motility-associated peptidyl-prolyl isomerase GldI [Abyssalbus ytuae]